MSSDFLHPDDLTYNNHVQTVPTIDRTGWRDQWYHGDEFKGKASKGLAASSTSVDHVTAPFAYEGGVQPDVNYVNDPTRPPDVQTRVQQQQRALDSFEYPSRRHDIQDSFNRPMDYEADHSVGHRQVDGPDPSPSLYNAFFRSLTPSQRQKRDVLLPGAWRLQQGMNRTVLYGGPPTDVPRPLIKERRNSDLRDIPSSRSEVAPALGAWAPATRLHHALHGLHSRVGLQPGAAHKGVPMHPLPPRADVGGIKQNTMARRELDRENDLRLLRQRMEDSYDVPYEPQ